jgi:hypothetical protein
MNFAAIVGFCSIWAMPFLRNNLQRHKRNQSAGDPLIEGETLFRVGHPPLTVSGGKVDPAHVATLSSSFDVSGRECQRPFRNCIAAGCTATYPADGEALFSDNPF